jgi:uncharacterized protein (UPF0332 family)
MLSDKAKANLQAGEILAAAGLADPAASRYYYAMFQAAIARLTALGWTPGRLSSGAVEWSHTMVMQNVFLVRRLRSDRPLFETMRDLRERADYRDDRIRPELLAAQIAAVRDFVEEAAP